MREAAPTLYTAIIMHLPEQALESSNPDETLYFHSTRLWSQTGRFNKSSTLQHVVIIVIADHPSTMHNIAMTLLKLLLPLAGALQELNDDNFEHQTQAGNTGTYF